MNISRNEHTIATTCEVSGTGYWSGQRVRVVMSPARVGTGILLVRSDLPGCPSCPATAEFRHDAQLRTILQRGDAQFQLVEHLMAALYAMEIDNCIVEIDAEELPGLDGSCAAYVDALQNAGLIIQAAEKKRLVIREPFTIRAADRTISAAPAPNGVTEFEYELSFDHECVIPNQKFRSTCTPDRFAREIAPARTFITQSQAQTLRAQGVASHVTNKDLLVFGDHGPIENTLRYSDECARHKLLDMIGDLALTGLQLVGQFSSVRGGHNLNGTMATQLLQLAQQQTMSRSNTNPNSQQQDRAA
ncbi:UDP-3-O-acyl-N-acetylglucosamine deacetylase [Stieleria varia]|uniref:UDP-3-O-acyl-N-acetylglucosamine deacetylase n=1 Tax=Stieleria varia TaxID=2528005 RepID=A0A5C5ZNB7_9BACT|nr:UDP-3-O-acyl-N-acetylglucosamine deacetylase [Stieleria varia]TWT87933.1 UDP-3-O-[3-hydroxymyristoyl] N-acetylglucosamine deacetylase [Stieleria varia]